jgi:hypothetical protein
MNVTVMPIQDRLSEVLQRSKSYVGPDIGAMVNQFMSPANLVIMAGTLGLWGGSHFFGVGEIIDVLLLAVGAFAIGWSIVDVAKDLYTFADRTLRGRTESDLDEAAQAFAHGIVLAGITVVMAVLLRRSIKQIQATRGANVLDAMRPRNPIGLPKVGVDPEAGKLWSKPGLRSDPALAPGEGSTSPFGEVKLSSAGTATEQALVRAHELVHRFLTPRFGPLRTFRVRLGMAGYLRSALLKYLEEALAETVAQIRVGGSVLEGLRFPVANGYMTISNLASEGAAIGKIIAGGSLFTVQFVPSVHHARTNANACYFPAISR